MHNGMYSGSAIEDEAICVSIGVDREAAVTIFETDDMIMTRGLPASQDIHSKNTIDKLLMQLEYGV